MAVYCVQELGLHTVVCKFTYVLLMKVLFPKEKKLVLVCLFVGWFVLLVVKKRWCMH